MQEKEDKEQDDGWGGEWHETTPTADGSWLAQEEPGDEYQAANDDDAVKLEQQQQQQPRRLVAAAKSQHTQWQIDQLFAELCNDVASKVTKRIWSRIPMSWIPLALKKMVCSFLDAKSTLIWCLRTSRVVQVEFADCAHKATFADWLFAPTTCVKDDDHQDSIGALSRIRLLASLFPQHSSLVPVDECLARGLAPKPWFFSLAGLERTGSPKVRLRPPVAPSVTTVSVVLARDADPMVQLSRLALALPSLVVMTIDAALVFGGNKHKSICWSSVLKWIERRELPHLAWFSLKRSAEQDEESPAYLEVLRARAKRVQIATGVHCVLLHGAADWLSSLPVEKRAPKRRRVT